jgi:LPXTG-motif cell wall-anchored protein
MLLRRPAVALSLTATALLSALVPMTSATAAGHSSAHHSRHVGSGLDSSDVLKLVLKAPGGAPIALPADVPSTLALGLLDVNGRSVSRHATHSATAFSGMFAPTRTPLDSLGGQAAASANEGGPTSATLPGSQIPANPLISGGVLTGSARVDKANDDSASTIRVADLDLLQLGQVLPASAFSQLQSGFTTLTGNLNTLIDALNNIPDPTGTIGIAAAVAQLHKLVTQLGDLPNDLQTTALIQLGSLEGSQSVTHHADGTVTATAGTTLGTLNLLAGLLRVTSVATSATASADGHGGGHASSAATVERVQLGKSSLVASLASDGKLLDLTLLGIDASALTKPVTDALDQVSTQLKSVLDMVGLTVNDSGQTSHHVGPDGKSASARADGLSVTLSPPGVGRVLSLSLGHAAASVRALEATASTPPHRPAPPRHHQSTGAPLPDTGGTALPAIVGSLLIGLAAVLGLSRRRQLRRA